METKNTADSGAIWLASVIKLAAFSTVPVFFEVVNIIVAFFCISSRFI